MFSSRQIFAFLCSSLLYAGAVSPAAASWLVYELQFKPSEEGSLNFSFYSGAYVVAPIAGGPASIVLTTEQDGRFFAVSQESARFFTAANPTSRKAVLSAFAINGSAQAYYAVSGLVNQTVSVPSPKGLKSYRVAGALKGVLVATDDDSEADALPADGSVGMVGSSEITGKLRDDLTHNANQFASQPDIVLYLVGLLERYGYTPDGEAAITTIEGVAIPDGINPDAASAALFPAGSGVDTETSTEPSPVNPE